MSKFNQWVTAIAEAGRELLARRGAAGGASRLPALADLCEELCTSRGEAMGTAIAHEVVKQYERLSADEKGAFFELLLTDYAPNAEAIARCAEAYVREPDGAAHEALRRAVEARRADLFRRINMAPGGMSALIDMRCALLKALAGRPELRAVDADLEQLLVLWFNRGFLSLEQISWRTPAMILEKLIEYEAVHAMSGWDDLRRRLAEDRRCFAFFHPALEDEPLIFVEVALVKGMADNIQNLLEEESGSVDDDFDTAIFYSISNCQPGLKGVSFGNFLIKQVVVELRQELPQLKQFATLSPIPGFRRWLDKQRASAPGELISGEEAAELEVLNEPHWWQNPAVAEALEPLLLRLCAHYVFYAKRNGKPLDSVARFHLGNGAKIARLDWLGDCSANGMQQSAGILINYAYELSSVEANHEAFVNEGKIAVASDFKRFLPKTGAGRGGRLLFGRSTRKVEGTV